ncbi:MAG: hypothetical protein ACK4GL_08160 [Flavobacteriales bacterium]
MNNYKVLLFLERFWLMVFIVGTLAAIWFYVDVGFDQAKFPIFVAFVAFILYILRRYQRKRQYPGK